MLNLSAEITFSVVLWKVKIMVQQDAALRPCTQYAHWLSVSNVLAHVAGMDPLVSEASSVSASIICTYALP